MLTSLGRVKVPSTSNRQRMFRSDEKPSDFSISSSNYSVYCVQIALLIASVTDTVPRKKYIKQIHSHIKEKMNGSVLQSVEIL